MHDLKKRSREIMIPSFGNWDSCDEFQITRYFESARQAGLLRGQSFRKPDNDTGVDVDLFKLDVVPPSPLQYYYCRKPRKVVVERKHQPQQQQQQNHQQQQRRRHDHQNRHHHRQPVQQQYQTNNQYNNNKASTRPAGSSRVSRAVDEDLYKIPPELLYRKPKRKALLAHLWKKCMSLDCVP